MKNFFKNTYESTSFTLGHFFRWIVLGLFVGVIVGLVSAVFSHLLVWATQVRTSFRWTFLLLPVGGLIIAFLYQKLHYEKGTDSVIESVEDENGISVRGRMGLLIFISTVITIFCGGSVGREGAALQIGGSLGKSIGDLIRMDDRDQKIMLMSGMAAAFSALFGTPMTAVFFAMEVSSVGIMHYTALIPCVCASLIAVILAKALGVKGEAFHILNDVSLNPVSAAQTVLVAACCAAASILFCFLLQLAHKMMKQYLPNAYVRITAGGLVLIALTLLVGTQDYLGTGMHVIEHAVEGHAVPWAFLLKMIFTSITIAAGFKGGEIVPSLFIGATLGCCLGSAIGLPVSLAAGIGMVSVFCGVTNCPVASMFIALELFGFTDPYFYLIAVAVSFMLSGYSGLYHTQKFTHSKYENSFRGRLTSAWFH